MGCTQIKELTKEPEPKQISGVVSEVRYIDNPEMTIVTFQDGRVKAFYGLSVQTFQKGKMNIISYSPRIVIVSVEIE
jgi:hypothetical protein